MSIPDPTIDPVTSLPLLNPSDVVQQIPLGVQIFPYTDLGATSLPTRGPLYGDDILPVSAFVAGQHPQTGSAQTVQTDGNHRLLVSDGGGSGGGVTPVPYFIHNYQKTMVAGSADTPITNVPVPCKTLYGFQYLWFSDTALGGVAFYTVALKMFDSSGNDPNTYTLWRGGIHAPAAPSGQGDLVLEVYQMFPIPRDCTAFSPAGIEINFMLTVGNNFNESNNIIVYAT